MDTRTENLSIYYIDRIAVEAPSFLVACEVAAAAMKSPAVRGTVQIRELSCRWSTIQQYEEHGSLNPFPEKPQVFVHISRSGIKYCVKKRGNKRASRVCGEIGEAISYAINKMKAFMVVVHKKSGGIDFIIEIDHHYKR